MKIHWHKIPKYFPYVVLTAIGSVKAYATKPSERFDLKEYCRLGWKTQFNPNIYYDVESRTLLENEEYELDGTEDWQTSLQERPQHILCAWCNGKKTISVIKQPDPEGDWMGDVKCPRCKETGVEPS